MRTEDCETLARARALASVKNLNPNLVTCPGCEEGIDCLYSMESEQEESQEDFSQDKSLKNAEGKVNINKFYALLIKHFEVIADQRKPKDYRPKMLIPG